MSRKLSAYFLVCSATSLSLTVPPPALRILAIVSATRPACSSNPYPNFNRELPTTLPVLSNVLNVLATRPTWLAPSVIPNPDRPIASLLSLITLANCSTVKFAFAEASRMPCIPLANIAPLALIELNALTVLSTSFCSISTPNLASLFIESAPLSRAIPNISNAAAATIPAGPNLISIGAAACSPCPSPLAPAVAMSIPIFINPVARSTPLAFSWRPLTKSPAPFTPASAMLALALAVASLNPRMLADVCSESLCANKAALFCSAANFLVESCSPSIESVRSSMASSSLFSIATWS